MAEQPVDLQLVRSAVRRHRGSVLAAALLGAALGAGSVFLSPPMYASSTLVLLPPKAANPDQMAELVKTDIRIVRSDTVLGPAAKSVRPRMSVEDLAEHLEVRAVTPLVLEVTGRADVPRRAEDIAAAVADAHVTYVAESMSALSTAARTVLTEREKGFKATLEKIEEQIRATTSRLGAEDVRSPQGTADARALATLTAQQGDIFLEIQKIRSQTEAVLPVGGASVIQEPSPAERPGKVTGYLGAVLIGAVLAALLAAGVITLLTRRDPRLYFRDDIADAVGSPVIASVRTGSTRSVADWAALLRDYTPSTVDAWAWRQALRQLVFVQPRVAGGDQRSRGHLDHPRSIVVITMSADPRGLATGPQLAAYAASAGIRTHIVAAQRHKTAAMLWAGLASLQQGQALRPGLSVDTRQHAELPLDLTVVLVVLDRHEPKLLAVPADAVVVLAVSAGSATTEDLARVAVSVDEAGERIHGIVVADPDHLDRTTGRLLKHDRMQQMPLPRRLTGTPPVTRLRSGSAAGVRQG